MTKLLAISGYTEDEDGNKGSAGAGKDTVADIIVQHYRGVRVGLADPMKRFAREIYGFTYEQLWGPTDARNAPDKRYPREHTWVGSESPSVGLLEEPLVCACCGWVLDPTTTEDAAPQCYLTPRYALQTLGTEWGRDNYEFTWILPMLKVTEALSRNGDARYTEERGLHLCHPSHTGEVSPNFVAVSDIRFPATLPFLKERGAINIRVKRNVKTLSGGSQHRSELALLETPDSAFDYVIHNYGTLADLAETVKTLVKGTHVKGIGELE